MGGKRRQPPGTGDSRHRSRGRPSFRFLRRRHARDRGRRRGSAAPLLRREGVAGRRGGRLLFEGLELALGPGEAALVTGPNGAGKSSLIRLAAGLLRAAAGRVERNGSMALADESAALDPRLTVGRALAFWARLDGAEVAAGLAAF